MFDIGFLEILVTLIVALLVIGPERMPEVARKIGSFVGRTRRFIDSVKEDSEIRHAVDELKEAVDFEEQKKELTSLSQEIHSDLNEVTHNIEPLDFNDLSDDAFHRPFDAPEIAEPGQFRKAPTTPEPPKPVERADNTDNPLDKPASPKEKEQTVASAESIQQTERS